MAYSAASRAPAITSERIQRAASHAPSRLLERGVDAAQRGRRQQQHVRVGEEHEHDRRAEQPVDRGQAVHPDRFECLGEQAARAERAEQGQRTDVARDHQREGAEHEHGAPQRQVGAHGEHRHRHADADGADRDQQREGERPEGGRADRPEGQRLQAVAVAGAHDEVHDRRDGDDERGEGGKDEQSAPTPACGRLAQVTSPAWRIMAMVPSMSTPSLARSTSGP
jgi:hypothetical protein